MKKRMSCLLLVLAFLIPTGVMAAEPEVQGVPEGLITPRFAGVTSAVVQLNVKGTTGSYVLDVGAKSGTTKITATLQIQKKNANGTYSNHGSSWSATANGRVLVTTGTKTVASGGTYRLKATIKVYKGTSYTTDTVYS